MVALALLHVTLSVSALDATLPEVAVKLLVANPHLHHPLTVAASQEVDGLTIGVDGCGGFRIEVRQSVQVAKPPYGLTVLAEFDPQNLTTATLSLRHGGSMPHQSCYHRLMLKAFRSRPCDIVLHPHNRWVDLDDEWEITSLPLYDERELLTAAVGRGPAIEWLHAHGMEIPTADDMRALHKVSFWVPPQTLPDVAMLIRDGVPKPWQDEDGNDTPWMARYRSANMMGKEWAAIHDYRVWVELAKRGWDGEQSVANFGKQWVKEGIFGWRNEDGTFIQGVSHFHDGDPTYDDYGTTVFAKRRKVATEIVLDDGERVPVTEAEISSTPPPPDTMPSWPEIGPGDSGDRVRDFQSLLIARGIALPQYGADGDFGDETVKAWGIATADAGSALADAPPWGAMTHVPAELWAWLYDNQAANLPGIDVSSNQRLPLFRWAELAAAWRWIVCRATYGVKPDSIFDAVIEHARAHKMAVGAYHFFRQQQDPQAQLDAFFARLDALEIGPGDIVPFIDLEDNERWDGKLDPTAHNTGGRWMVEQVAKRYGRAGIYTAPYHFINLGGASWMYEHDIWVADYGTGRKWPRWPEVTGNRDWAMWQTKPRTIVGYGKTAKDVIDVNVARRLPLIP